MVTTLQAVSKDEHGCLDREAWLNTVSFRYPKEKLKGLSEALQQADETSLEVATILLGLHADPLAIQAALYLHQLYDKNKEQLKALPIRAEVLPILLNLAELTQVSQKLDLSKQKTLEAMRRMLLAMIKDVRVALIKLAIITHQARSFKKMTLEQRKKDAKAIEQIYAPLANRLGVAQLKWELEDRAFAVLQPEQYQEITKALHERRSTREMFMQNWIERLDNQLGTEGYKVEINGRIKHIYSIWKKMQQKHLSFAELYDIRALRILVQDIPTCYQVMAFLHEHWTPLTSEYTDYIVQPKPNGYRSLHTVLKGEDGQPIEIQIRTFTMHVEAEKGVAAHWRYKEGSQHDLNLAERLNWLRMLLDWQKEWDDPASIDEKNIYVFTKSGDVVSLPRGATPIDFAFAVHSDLGLRCKGAYVNGRIVPLNYPLAMTDQVEIITHKEAHPSRDWLRSGEGFIKSSKAKSKLRAWFRSVDEQPEQKQVEEVNSHVRITNTRKITETNKQQKINLGGMKGLPYQFAKCCNPEGSQEIIGYLTTQRGVVIHQKQCHHIQNLSQERKARLLNAQWQ